MEAEKPKLVIKGFLYVVVENFQVASVEEDITCHLSLGAIAKCETKPAKSGAALNEVFLIEVPSDPSRLILEFKKGEALIGDCRYDVNPFFTHPNAPHTIASDIFDEENQNKGTVNIKITYYSAEFGKLRIRIFHLSLTEPFIEKFKKAKLKIKSGVFAQTSLEWEMDKDFDQRMEVLVLAKNLNLDFDVVSDDGILAKYTIYDLEKSGLLIDDVKAYQVSLFNGDKAVGTIKYQVEWIHA